MGGGTRCMLLMGVILNFLANLVPLANVKVCSSFISEAASGGSMICSMDIPVPRRLAMPVNSFFTEK